MKITSLFLADVRSPISFLFVLIVLRLASVVVHAQSSTIPAAPRGVLETGAPSFVVLGPEAIGLSTPPTDLHLLPDGRVMLAGQREIAFSDGVRWEVFDSATDQALISAQVAVGPDGQIYAGISGKIAKIEFGDDALWRFNPVTKLPAEDPSIRSTTLISVDMLSDQWLWHSGSGAIISWRPGEVARTVGSINAIERIFSLGSSIFVSEQGAGGLFRLTMSDGVVVPVEAAPHLGSETVTSSVTFGPGQLLVGTNLAGLKLFDGTNFKPFSESSLLGRTHRINDLCAVTADLFAAAIDTVGIVVFDREGRVVQVLDRSLDHRLSRVLRLRFAKNGVIWGLLNEGVVRMEYPSPYSHFEPLVPSGLSFARPVRHHNHLWLLADGLAMRGVYDIDGRFERFEQKSPPGLFLFTLDDVEGDLFASNETGIFIHEETGWKMAAAGIVNARVGITPANASGLLYVARDELGFLQKTPSGFTTRRFPMPGLGDNYNAVTDEDGLIWLELGNGRVGRLDPRLAQPTIEVFGTKDGLSDGWVEIYQLQGITRFHVANHVLRFDKASGKFIEDKELLRRFPQFAEAGGRPIADASGRIWYSGSGAARVIEPNGTPNDRTLPVGFAPTQFTVEGNGDVVWMIAKRRFTRMDSRVSAPPREVPKAQITSVHFPVRGRHHFTSSLALGPIAYADNSLIFHFAAPANPFATPVTFEVLLEGASNQWVSTGAVGTATFSRLKEGDYVFRVRPIIAGMGPGREARLTFTVLPPWYRTTLAWFIYAGTAIFLIGFALWFFSFLQRRENERLEELVTKRTKELNATNSELEKQIGESTEKSIALSASEDRFRTLNTELEARVQKRTAELSSSNQELQQREVLFRLIFEHAPVGISWKRADLGDAYHFNPMFRRTLGLPASALTNYTNLATLVHPEDAPRHAELSNRIETGLADDYTIEQRYLRNDGVVVWGRLSVAVVRDSSGRVIQDISILEDITSRKQAERDLANINRNLVDVSRTAGMAEVATGVLHNVGNVLNSVNVSATIVIDHVRLSKTANLAKICTLLDEHKSDLGVFMNSDPKGQIIPSYLNSLVESLAVERKTVIDELTNLRGNIEHIKEIVAMQQAYAKTSGVIETVTIPDVVEDALRMQEGSLSRHDISVTRDYQAKPVMNLDKHKVMQILVNLIRNAKHACDDSGRTDKKLTVRITDNERRVRISVSDNGVGIPRENLTRIFNHGFTTRKNGHGFGLHSGALAARELGGSLTVLSDGPGTGAVFTLELPEEKAHVTQQPAANKAPATLARYSVS